MPLYDLTYNKQGTAPTGNWVQQCAWKWYDVSGGTGPGRETYPPGAAYYDLGRRFILTTGPLNGTLPFTLNPPQQFNPTYIPAAPQFINVVCRFRTTGLYLPYTESTGTALHIQNLDSSLTLGQQQFALRVGTAATGGHAPNATLFRNAMEAVWGTTRINGNSTNPSGVALDYWVPGPDAIVPHHFTWELSNTNIPTDPVTYTYVTQRTLPNSGQTNVPLGAARWNNSNNTFTVDSSDNPVWSQSQVVRAILNAGGSTYTIDGTVGNFTQDGLHHYFLISNLTGNPPPSSVTTGTWTFQTRIPNPVPVPPGQQVGNRVGYGITEQTLTPTNFTPQATFTNGTHGTFQYGNGFNGAFCWNRNFTLTGTSPTDADNPAGTIWRLRATGVTGTHESQAAAAGITLTASGLNLDSGGFGGYQACLTFDTTHWNGAFGSAHTNSASNWTNAVWHLEKQTTPITVTWNAGTGAASQTGIYQANGAFAVNDTTLSGTFPTDLSGNWRLRRADNSAITSYGTLTSVQGSGFKTIRIGTLANMTATFGTSQILSGSGWVLEQQPPNNKALVFSRRAVPHRYLAYDSTTNTMVWRVA